MMPYCIQIRMPIVRAVWAKQIALCPAETPPRDPASVLSEWTRKTGKVRCEAPASFLAALVRSAAVKRALITLLGAE